MNKRAIVAGVGLGVALTGCEPAPLSAPEIPPYPIVWHMSASGPVSAHNEQGQCRLEYGAAIVPTRQGILYAGRPEDSSDCQPGTILDMSLIAARQEETAYQRLQKRKQAIQSLMQEMVEREGEPAVSVDQGVTVANPYPVTKIYADRSRELWSYGKVCVARGVAVRVGVLADGEVVMRLHVPPHEPYDHRNCPPKTLFVVE